MSKLSNTLNVLIIDDEPGACRILETMLKEYCQEINVQGMAHSVAEGEAAIRKHQPKLVFLDVQMPDGSGFDVLDRFPDRSFEVIFVTAYEEYAVKALRSKALDYLLKPTDFKEVQDAVQNYRNRVQIPVLSTLERPRKLTLPVSNGLVLVPLDDILMVNGDGNYCHFHVSDGRRITVSRNLKFYSNQLTPHRFFRTHQSYLVNMDKVQGYLRNGMILLPNKLEAELARSRKQEFLDLIQS